ncbi:MAG: ABC transporter ATP-binding protein [Tumebacillaceae bacterium]
MNARTTDKTPFLSCEGVSVQFYDGKSPVLSDMSVAIRERESVLLLGPSGSGKTTLLQVLAGIIPHSIEAWFKGTVTRPDRVGVMFQDPDAQFCMLTVEDEIAFSLENLRFPPERMRGRMEELLREVRLDVPLHWRINELSGGMKQRLALACLLSLEPEVLFFDEPTAQLDPQNTAQVLSDIRKLKGEKTLVLIEHKLDGVIDWVDRVLLFDPQGRLQGDGRPEDVLRDHADAIRESGIWQPKLWPVQWDELLGDQQHPVARRLAAEWQAKAADLSRGLHGSSPLVDVRGAEMRYKKGHTVWSSVDVQVQPGEWVAIVGPNGAGKSTFLKTVGGLLDATAGSVRFKDKEVSRYKPEQLYDAVGFVFQNPEHQFIADTVFEEVAFGGKLAGWPEERIEREATKLLADFHLLEARDKNPFALSQGQKRRLSVAGMLLKNQELLLLDEPTFGQDAATTRELLQRLQERNEQGTTIMMATHDVELVSDYATRVLVFAEGGVLFDGTPHELFGNEELLKRASLTAPLAYEYHLCARKEENVHV